MAKKELPDEYTVVLRKPVTLGTGADAETYYQLELREPFADEMLDFSNRSRKDPGDALKTLIAKVSGVPLAVVAKIRSRDFNISAQYLTNIMDPDYGKDESEDDADGADEPSGRKPAGDALGK